MNENIKNESAEDVPRSPGTPRSMDPGQYAKFLGTSGFNLYDVGKACAELGLNIKPDYKL